MHAARTVRVVTLLLALTPAVRAESPSDARVRQLAERVERLEQRVQDLEKAVAPVKKETDARSRAQALRAHFEARLAQDAKTYSMEQRREIESLYQVANKQWRSPEAKQSLETLITKYDKANRTGCAVLYLGQMSEGADAETYLKKAAADFADCWYGDGVQVGAYARYLLAYRYDQSGRKDEAAKLFREVRENYPDAIDHQGNLLSAKFPAAP